MNQEVFADNIRNWAEARNLLSLDSIANQGLYLISETGEAVGEHLKGNLPAMMLELGDILVVLQVMRLQAGIECPEEPAQNVLPKRTLPVLLRAINSYSLEAVALADAYPISDDDSSGKPTGESKTRLNMTLRRVYLNTCRAIQTIGSTPDQARQAVWDKIANRTGKTVDGVFIKDAPSPELGWTPTAESGHYWAQVFEQDGWEVLRYCADAELFYSYMGRDSFDPEELFKIGARIERPASND